MSASNIRHIQNPSEGTLIVYNPTDEDLSLVANTRFITDDGIFFKATNAFRLPAGTEEEPGQATIRAIAMEVDNDNVIIGTRGNIQA